MQRNENIRPRESALWAIVVLFEQRAQAIDSGVADAVDSRRVDALKLKVPYRRLARREMQVGVTRDAPAKQFFGKRIGRRIGAQGLVLEIRLAGLDSGSSSARSGVCTSMPPDMGRRSKG